MYVHAPSHKHPRTYPRDPAQAILRSRAAADVAAEIESVAAAHALWCDYKLFKTHTPPPELEPRVLPGGYTVLNPFLAPPRLPTGLPPGPEFPSEPKGGG